MSHAPASGSKTLPSHSRKPTAPAASLGGTMPNPTRDSCRSAWRKLLIPHRPWCTNHSTLPHYALTSAKSDRLLVSRATDKRRPDALPLWVPNLLHVGTRRGFAHAKHVAAIAV